MKKLFFSVLAALLLLGTTTHLHAADATGRTEQAASNADYHRGVIYGGYVRAAAVTNDDLIGPYETAQAERTAAAQAGDWNAFDYWSGYIDGLGPVLIP
ncbi:hypothetical protein [Hymenobacter rigui]|uniref:Uncharacterized protein n=1 Tax=Hymenobacter rigui TaxID=334424 RepID=A0A428KFT0_9BACT|nr:hypothetical protein [Hymenobacter rigui]RSK45165.1 hypothetical protein EI291_18820 [Hymenobacter rigui]